MRLINLTIRNFRNFTDFQLIPGRIFNLIVGDNGTGKTSLIEAIYMLGMGRSFRTHLINQLVQHHHDKFSIFGLIETVENKEIPIGIEKSRQGESKVRMLGENVRSVAQLASLCPLLLITNDSFLLLNGGPKYRRQYMDWGSFHVKQSFISVWREYSDALKQRNLAIKKQLTIKEISSWDRVLVKNAELLEQMRWEYINHLIPIFEELLGQFNKLPKLTLNYVRGWSANKTLSEVLQTSINNDLKLGYTQYGSHRSDLVIKIKELPAQDILSRGQQKIVVTIMQLAQGILLKKITGKVGIYLIDDLVAELDETNTSLLSNLLGQLEAQVFITGVDHEQLKVFSKEYQTTLFHVKQ